GCLGVSRRRRKLHRDGPEVAICGTNSVSQVRRAAGAASMEPADEQESARILREAPELGRYVCRRCGTCSEGLMRTFELEGWFDRQMIDFQPHGAADGALRKVLAGWFSKTDAAREAFARIGLGEADLLADAETVSCPYDIDVPRKTRLACAKLTGAKPNLI
ncbi:MAG: hypothetical protein ACLFVH_01395, partial [Phycisphaerae bacterium]